MSSGACRALVAALLTLAAALAQVLPAVAASDQLREDIVIRYTIDPDAGQVRVVMIPKLENGGNRAFSPQTWGAIVLEDRAPVPRLSNADFSMGGVTTRPGLWKALSVSAPRIEPGASVRTRIEYIIDASIANGQAALSTTPARVGRGYFYLCLLGQDVDLAQVTVNVPDGFSVTQTGTRLLEEDGRLEIETNAEPADVFTCIEGTDDSQLVQGEFIGPDDRRIILQAWPEQPNWLSPAQRSIEPVLDELRSFLGYPIPGNGPVIIRQAPPRSLGGHASSHATPGIVQLDEQAGVAAPPYHEMAHAWFTADDYPERWMREGLAQWTASSVQGGACPPVDGGEGAPNLSTWQVVRPTAPDDIDAIIEAQEAAACGIMSAVAGRMGDDAWQTVLGSLLRSETKYVGRATPGAAPSRTVDYREWLDAVDERGLVPSGIDDLDYAQDLLLAYGIPTDVDELALRSQARARYHAFRATSGALGAPQVVREAMDNWFFTDAMMAMDRAEAVVAALTAADDLLPEAGLVPVIQPAFEAAATLEALDQVLVQAEALRTSATEILGPLTDLRNASPETWSFPAALRNAITDLDFDVAVSAIDPSLEIVEDLVAADAALPEANLLEVYRARYESTATVDRLDGLADAVRQDRVAAEITGASMSALRAEVGEWAIPEAVTRPIERAELPAAQAIVEDARGVVRAARAADLALPEADISKDIRPLFEGVTTGAEMATLRTQAEKLRSDAQIVGSALDSLRSLVPDWAIPAVVTDPVAARQFTTAAQAAQAAERWVRAAARTDEALPDFGARERIKEQFEGATTLQQLLAGAELAESWESAARRVSEAIAVVGAPRDLLADLGLWGTDVQPEIDAAREAAIAGNVQIAAELAGQAIQAIESGSSSGALRLTGLIFFAVAILGVLGMWFIFRRQRGPSWARQTKPHWMKDEKRQRQLRSRNEPPGPPRGGGGPRRIGPGRR